MDETELAAIQARGKHDDVDTYWNGLSDAYEQASADRSVLLVEVDRLQVALRLHQHALQKCADDNDRLEVRELMSEARLHEIRVKAYDAYDWDDWKARAMLGEMLTEHDRLAAEVERIRAREAALVEVVEKVWTLAVQSAYDDKWFIPHVHAAHELVEQARALLAQTPTASEA